MAKPGNNTSKKQATKTKLAGPMAKKAVKDIDFANIFIFDQPLGEAAKLQQAVTVVQATAVSADGQAEVPVVIAKVSRSSMAVRREAKKLDKPVTIIS